MQKVITKKDINMEVLLESNMSLMDKVKSLLPSFRYNVGGKNALNPFNRAAIKKIDADRKAQLDAIVNNAANKLIKDLDTRIKIIAPNFPNDTDSKKFIAAIEEIAYVYEQIKAATQKNPPEMDVDTANALINNLSEYLKYFIEVKLQSRYTVVNEEIELSNENELLDELFDTTAKDIRNRFRSATPQGQPSKSKTTRTKQLESNKLPASLAKIGAVLGALGWLTKIPTLINMLRTSTAEVVAANITESATNIKPGEGITQVLNRMLGDEGVNLSPQSTGADFLDAVTKLGGGDTNLGIESLGKISNNAKNVITQIYRNHNQYDSTPLGQLFTGNWAGTGALKGDLLVTKGGEEIIDYDVLVETLETFKDTVLSTVVAGIGSVILPLGITMIAAGALVKLARMKGLRDSRAATLETLYQMMREVQPTTNNSSLNALPPGPSQGRLGQGKPEPENDKEQDSSEQAPETIKTQAQLGAGETPETQKQLGGRPKPRELGAGNRSITDRIDATDVEAEPVSEPEKPKQLPGGQSVDVETLKNNLADFFKSVLAIKPKKREAIAEARELDKLNIYKEDSKKQKQIEDFQKNAELLSVLAKNINLALRNPKISTDSKLENLLRKLQQNVHHGTIVDIKPFIKYHIKNRDFILKFITIYLTAIKQTRFGKILNYVQPDEQKKPIQLNEAALTMKNTEKFLTNFDIQFRVYLTDLYKLLVYLNKPATKPTTKPAAPASDYEYTGAQLEEGKKKKKNKYSKKASEFIGKEISHLKKDKGYPQDRAVAAAINVAKEKGMKVGAKKKKSK